MHNNHAVSASFFVSFNGRPCFLDENEAADLTVLLNNFFNVNCKLSPFDMGENLYLQIEIDNLDAPEELDIIEELQWFAESREIDICGRCFDDGKSFSEAYFVFGDSFQSTTNPEAERQRLLSRFIAWDYWRRLSWDNDEPEKSDILLRPFQIMSMDDESLFWDEVAIDWVSQEKASRYNLTTLPVDCRNKGRVVMTAKI